MTDLLITGAILALLATALLLFSSASNRDRSGR